MSEEIDEIRINRHPRKPKHQLSNSSLQEHICSDGHPDWGDGTDCLNCGGGTKRNNELSGETEQSDFAGLVAMATVAALDGCPWVEKGHLWELSSTVAALAAVRKQIQACIPREA